MRTDLEVLHALAVRLGQDAGRFPVRPREVFDELRRASAGARVGLLGHQLRAPGRGARPCTGPARPAATAPAIRERAAVPGPVRTPGRARPVRLRGPPAVRPGTRRDLPPVRDDRPGTGQYQSGAQTRRVPELVEAAPETVVEMHPDTARRFGLADGADGRGRLGATAPPWRAYG
ncbi:hypothetical protein GCM10023238_36850 [Streptomyces heliomycini]